MAAEVQVLTHEFRPFTGGIGVYVEELARAAAGGGHKTTVWAPDYGASQADTFPFAVRRIRMRGKQDWLCRMRFAAALRKGFPNGHIPGTTILAEPGPIRLWMHHRFMRLPQAQRLVIIFHGSELRALSQKPRHRRLLVDLLARADCIGCVSGPVRAAVSELAPDVADKLVMVPGAVRSSWSGLPPVPRRNEGGIREILQVGRIHPRKGQLMLVEAIALLPDALRESIRVRLVGPVGRKAYAEALQTRIRELGLPVVVEGPVSEDGLRESYERAAVAVLPSQPFRDSVEGLGLALLEAQHFACPVIGTRLGGIPEALEEGSSGILVPPGSPRELARALEMLLSDPQRASDMGVAGARFVRNAFSWEANLCKLGISAA
jgi:glycosyltransferase involved in cell wall biosynthesis